MRAAAKVLWSSGNEPKSVKHSLNLTLGSENSRLLRRHLSRSGLEIMSSLDQFFILLRRTTALCPRNDAPITSRASGNPPQTFNICNLWNQITFVILLRLQGLLTTVSYLNYIKSLEYERIVNMIFFPHLFTLVLQTIDS